MENTHLLLEGEQMDEAMVEISLELLWESISR